MANTTIEFTYHWEYDNGDNVSYTYEVDLNENFAEIDDIIYNYALDNDKEMAKRIADKTIDEDDIIEWALEQKPLKRAIKDTFEDMAEDDYFSSL